MVFGYLVRDNRHLLRRRKGRYVTTEVMYAARFEAEERIRRQVLASLNTQLLPRPQIA